MPVERPEGLLAACLVEHAMEAGAFGVLFIARSEARAARLHRAARALAPGALQAMLLPAWDCLPYDRVSPSRAIMGERMAVAAQLARGGDGPRLLIAGVDALMQRLPRPDPGASLRLSRGGAIDVAQLQSDLLRLGFLIDDSADDPGEASFHGATVDVYSAWEPGGYAWRLRHEDGRIIGIDRFDPPAGPRARRGARRNAGGGLVAGAVAGDRRLCAA